MIGIHFSGERELEEIQLAAFEVDEWRVKYKRALRAEERNSRTVDAVAVPYAAHRLEQALDRLHKAVLGVRRANRREAKKNG